MDQLRGTNKTTLLEHMPHVHKKSVTRSVRFDSEESVLECAKALDEGVYIFCQNRLRFAQNDGVKYLANAKSSCGAVIDFYNAELNKSLVSEACRYVISSLEPRYWNKQSVVEQYRHLLQLEQERKNSQSTSKKKHCRRTLARGNLRHTFKKIFLLRNVMYISQNLHAKIE